MKARFVQRCLGLAVLLTLATSSVLAELSEQEKRGRLIYHEGRSPSGAEIVARVAGGRTELPATTLPCTSCHGAAGKGQPAGASNISWPAISAPASPVRGRQRPAYDETLLRRAITGGVDAGGSSLAVNMPRYRLTRSDAADLIAYLRHLDGTGPEASTESR